MDNNQNNNQPVQPQQANPFGQQPQSQQQANPFGQQPQPQQQANPFGQQPQPQQQANPFGQQSQPQQQVNNPFGNQFSPKNPTNIRLGLISLIAGAVSLVMAIIGSIFACTCSAAKSWSVDNMIGSFMDSFLGSRSAASLDIHSTSAVIIVNIIAAIIAIAAVVIAIISLKKNASDKMSKIAIALGAFAFLYAILPVLTICGYNCSLNNNFSNL